MALTSLKAMKIISKGDEVYIQASKKLTLSCGKTAVVIEPSGITILAPGDVNAKCASINQLAPQSFSPVQPELPPEATCVESVR